MKITDAASFGRALRQRRKDLHYTQAFLAEFSGLSVSFISDLENGKSTTELGKALFLSNLLGLDCSLDSRGELS
ncbi:MAG: helix-turn-helix transcriptional regulator [Eubacterium sp.]|nr:helix-turn-helix transcriptional regulator [Eubacterium sp.]